MASSSRTWAVWGVWLAARLASLSLLTLPRENTVTSDVVLYHQWSIQAWDKGILPGRDFSWEYPAGAFPLVALPFPVHSLATYTVVFIVQCLALDAVVLGLLLRRTNRHDGSRAGVWLWVLAPPLLGPMAYLRLDLAPLALVVGALTLVQRAPKSAGAMLALATAVKLWPVVVVLALLRTTRRRAELLAGFAVTAVVVVAATAAFGIVDSFRTSLQVQSERGVQVESFAALPWLWLRALGAHVGLVFRHFATEIDVHAAAPLGLAWTVVVGIALLALLWRAQRQSAAADWLPAACVGLLLVGDKVLSPQYLLWLVGLVAWATTTKHPYNRALVGSTLLMVALTHAVFPIGYEIMLSGGVPPLLLLTLRDAILVVLVVMLCRFSLARPSDTDLAPRPNAAVRA